MIDPTAFIHPLANVEDGAEIGAHTKVWQFATVRTGAVVGASCIVGQGAFVDSDVIVGDSCKLENYASLHRGTRIGAAVFIGPGVIFTNDRWPASTNSTGGLKSEAEWTCEPVTVRDGASVGARAVLLPGVTVGERAMVGAGAVVTRDVPASVVVAGNPAKVLRRIG